MRKAAIPLAVIGAFSLAIGVAASLDRAVVFGVVMLGVSIILSRL
jgi:hypothetical protein